jgi:Sec-independent protein translocase protein TatA
MFDLGPEKIMVILAAVCLFVGPKEIPAAARKIGAVMRQLRSWQDTLRAEVSSVLALDPEPSAPPTFAPPRVAEAPEPESGDSFI